MFTINLKLYYKLEKKHIVLNVLLYLYRNDNLINNSKELDKINTLYLQIYILITMHTAIIKAFTTYFVTLIEKDSSITLL